MLDKDQAFQVGAGDEEPAAQLCGHVEKDTAEYIPAGLEERFAFMKELIRIPVDGVLLSALFR